MCGLTGVAGKIGKREEDIFRDLLVVDALRGTDSTGIAAINAQFDVKIAKQVGNPYELFDTKSYDKALKGLNRVLIGHNRYSTMGVSNRANAHPFQFDHITGAHNGTLKNKWELLDGKDFDVDSQALYNHIAKEGIRRAITKADGAWALTWWDANEKTLNFLRNQERPLWMLRSNDGKTLFWASELWMMEGILDRSGVKYGDPHLVEKDFHYKIGIGQDGELVQPILQEIKSGHVYQGYVPNHGKADNNPFTSAVAGTSTSTAITAIDTKKESRPVLSLVGQQRSSYSVPEGYCELEIIATGRDKFGAHYFKLLDWAYNEADIRLYYTRVPFDPDIAVGATIKGVVNKTAKTVNGKTYWKVEANSVNWKDVNINTEDVKETVIYDHHNREIGEVEFYKRYSSCCWCEDTVHPHQKHILTTNGEALCSECCITPDITQYVSAVGGIRGNV